MDGKAGAFFEWIEHDGAPMFMAAVTGALSFSHIRDLALHHSQSQWQADAYPVAVDAITLYALSKVLRPNLSWPVKLFAWAVFLAFCGASLAANLLDAPAHSRSDLFVAVLPSLAFLAATILRRFTDPAEAPAQQDERKAEPEPVTKPRRPAASRPKSPGARSASTKIVAQALKDFLAQHPEGNGPQFAKFANARLREANRDEYSPGGLRNKLANARRISAGQPA